MSAREKNNRRTDHLLGAARGRDHLDRGVLPLPGFPAAHVSEVVGAEVAAFYADHTSRVRYSMILFNWFCVALIPILMLIVERMRGMAHRTPILRYCVIGVAGAAPIAFLTATVFWLFAAFRPHRAPALTQLYNDLAWITFTCGVPFLVALCLFLAVAIYLDEQARPVFARWVGHFNLLIAIALVPAGFAGLTLAGPFAWNGFLSFWVRTSPSPSGSSSWQWCWDRRSGAIGWRTQVSA